MKYSYEKPKQAVILCGGLGTRLKPYTLSNPKPMILCNKKPFIWHLMKQLDGQGITNFVLLTGYLSKKIENYFGDGNKFGWNINYSIGPVEWDTGKRIWEAKDLLEECFVLLYSDNIAPFSIDKVLETHYKNKLPMTLMVVKKKPGNIKLNDVGIVQNYYNNRLEHNANYVEIGYMIVEKKIMFNFIEDSNCSFSKVIKSMSKNLKLGAWIQNDVYHSVSDPIRWKKADNYLTNKKIIFIDRDGVINYKAPKGEYITRWEDFKIIPDTISAMKVLSSEGFQFIIITNQAGIARNKMDYNQLNIIHNKLGDFFKQHQIKVLKIYTCPHHWNDNCNCRKPKPGMFYLASREFNIRLDKSLFIGDDIRDCQAAYNAGLKSVYLGAHHVLEELPENQKPIYHSEKLSNIIPNIFNFFL
jgi:histidinol-phosphate phosphatase family protein